MVMTDAQVLEGSNAGTVVFGDDVNPRWFREDAGIDEELDEMDASLDSAAVEIQRIKSVIAEIRKRKR